MPGARTAPGPGPGAALSGPRYRFDRAPLRVYWETTRACDLACRHCRAEAAPHGDPDELTTAEGRALLGRLAGIEPPLPHVVLTGGDPLKRGDFFDLVRHARGLGLPVSVAPSGTPLLTEQIIERLRAEGVEAISLSLDGATEARHDRFRGVPGCYRRTMAAAAAARRVELPFQVNTLVAAETRGDLPAIHERVVSMGAARWSLFFLVTVGRGAVLNPVAPAQAEELLHWLADLPAGRPAVTTTEAPHFRRVLMERRARGAPAHGAHGAGIRDGNGILFISNTGDVTPSGFLEIPVGNVRTHDPIALYRDAPLFRQLRAPEQFKGRCGICEYRDVCGGSRARAWAATGDALAEDPLCAYQPGGARPGG